MALGITVTKVSTKKVMDKMYTITLNLLCTTNIPDTDPVEKMEVINKDFSSTYKTTSQLSDTFDRLQKDMQTAIDEYKSEQVIYKITEFDTRTINIQDNLKG